MPVDFANCGFERELVKLDFTSGSVVYDFSPNGQDLTVKRLTNSLEAPVESNAPESIVRIVFHGDTYNPADSFVLYLRVYLLRKVHGLESWAWYFEASFDQVGIGDPTVSAVRCFIDESGEFGAMQYINKN